MTVLPTGRWKAPILRLTYLGTVSRTRNRFLPITVSEAVGSRLIAKGYATPAVLTAPAPAA